MCVLYFFSLYYSYVVSLLRDAMLARYLLSPCVRLSVHHKEIPSLKKLGYSRLELCPKLWTCENFAILQVYRVVNKTRCRRGWWSLLTTQKSKKK